jgi:tetratricopeptide (TPR) repeat protein
VLAYEIDDAPAAVALLDVREGECRDLGTAEPEAALDEAQRAQQLGPDSPLVWNNLGMVWLRSGDWNIAEAEKALRKAVELDPEDELSRTNLAILLEYNANGWRYGNGARLDEAFAVYREIVKQPHQAMVDQPGQRDGYPHLRRVIGVFPIPADVRKAHADST